MGGSISISVATALLAILVGNVSPPAIEPTISIVKNYYEITGTSAASLRKQMKSEGPKGYWAYTRWRIKWSSDCKVRLTVNYTFPKLKNPDNVPLPLRKRFQAMLVKLKAHEEGHGQNGRDAAAEILAADCKDARAIIKKYAAKDKSYDKKTRHGYRQGVRLDN
jgi:predicted secreted Zn-dependent protease